MSNIWAEKSLEWISQTKTLEMPSEIRMIELSKTYLASIEKKFGTFLEKIGYEPGNYDGNLSGNQTGAEKIMKEKILPLQQKIEKEKHSLKKHELMTNLTKAILEAKGLDTRKIQSLVWEKENKAKKFSSELPEENDFIELQNELSKEASKLDGAYVREWTKDTPHSIMSISKSNSEALENLKTGKISSDEYLKIIQKNTDSAKAIDAEKEVSEALAKSFELSMRSGAAPVVMMAFSATRKIMPALPVMIGWGMYYRWYQDTLKNEKKSLWEKTWDTTKVASYTVASIAPITWSIIAIKEASESWDKVKNGTGNKSEAIADSIWAGISVIFDGVTIVMAATGVWVVPAAWVATGRKAAVEWAKFGMKKIISKAGHIFDFWKNALIDVKNSWKALIWLQSSRSETGKIVSSGFSSDVAKKVWTELGKDTLRWSKDILTFKWVRDVTNKLLFKAPAWIWDAYKKLRPTKFAELRDIWITAKVSNLEEKASNKELESIDSKKHSLSPETTKELLDSLDIKMGEIAQKSKKLSRLQHIIKNKNNDDIQKHELSRAEQEIQKLKIEIQSLSTLTNKIFDILDYRAKLMAQSGKNQDEAGNEAMWKILHKNLKTYLTNEYISHDIKINILSWVWPSSIRTHGYLKKDSEFKDQIAGRSNSIEKLAWDVFHSPTSTFEQKSKLLLLLWEKWILSDVNIIKDGKTTPLLEIIDPFLRETSGDILIQNSYYLNRLFQSIPNLNTQKNLINQISDSITKHFKAFPKNETPGQFIASIDFLHTHGTLQRVMTNTIMRDKLKTYIESITPENFHMRGTFNMIEYFRWTTLNSEMELRIKKLENAGILSKDFTLPEWWNDKNLQKEIKEIEQKINNTQVSLRDIETLLSDKERVLFSHKELVDLFQKHSDILKTDENIAFLDAKINESSTHIEVKNLFWKLLWALSPKYIALTSWKELSPGNIIRLANQKEIDIHSLKNIMVWLETSAWLSNYDKLIAMDILKNNYSIKKWSNHRDEKSFCGLYENFLQKNPTLSQYHLIENIQKGDKKLHHAFSLAKKWGMELQIDYTNGLGVHFTSKENGDIVAIDFSQMSNIRSDLLDIIISHAPFSNGKYFENIGRVNQVAVKTKFDEKIQSSEHLVFQNILNFNRVLKEFKLKDGGFKLEDAGFKQLLSEYHIENLGERFVKKIILCEYLIANGKQNIVLDVLKQDIHNKKISGEIKMSLVHNIQDHSLRDELFKELIAWDALSIKDYQHDMFKKLTFKIDNESINTNVVENILKIKDEIIRGENLETFDGLISIIQESQNISGTSEKILMGIFKEIKWKIKNINADNINENYMKLLIEFGRIEKLRDQPEVLATLSSNIESRHASDPLMSKALEYGMWALKRYHNFDNVRFGEAGLNSLKDLKWIIVKKISIIWVQSSDLFEKNSSGEQVLKFDEHTIGELWKELTQWLKDIGVSPTAIIGNELYVKIDGTGKELSFSELMRYKEALMKLKSIQKDMTWIKAWDIFHENMSAYSDILQKAGFDVPSYLEYKKTWKISENMNNETRDFIQTSINRNSGNIHKLDNQVKWTINNETITAHEQKWIWDTKIHLKDVWLPDNILSYIPPEEIARLPREIQSGKIFNLKNILFILITLKIMTPNEAQAAAQDIEQSWKSSAEFKRFNELGGEKSQEAMKIKEETVRRLAGEKLKPFIEGFDERIRDRNREKVAAYPATIQVILSTAYEKWFPLIKDKSQRNLNIFNGWLITYIDQVYNGTGKAEQAAQNLLKRFPEFEWTPFQKTILEIWKNIDTAALNITQTNERKKIIETLKKL